MTQLSIPIRALLLGVLAIVGVSEVQAERAATPEDLLEMPIFDASTAPGSNAQLAPLDPVEAILGPDARTRGRRIDHGEDLGMHSTCIELYNAVTQLQTVAEPTRPDAMDNPVNTLVMAAGSIVPAAYLLVAIPAVVGLAEDRHVDRTRESIARLRGFLAAKHCFVR